MLAEFAAFRTIVPTATAINSTKADDRPGAAKPPAQIYTFDCL